MWHWQRSEQVGVYEGYGDVHAALQGFVQWVIDQHPQIAPFVDQQKSLIVARAPGRLDVMGGIADYSGSTVLQLPLQESAVVLAQTTSDRVIRVISANPKDSQQHRTVNLPLEHFFHTESGLALTPEAMQTYFSGLAEDQRWVAYVAGVLPVLMEHCNCQFSRGMILYVYSTVPEGKGVSSSAAVEVAAMRAITAMLDLSIDAHQQAVLCQRVENRVVGAPCGLMDQMTSSLGKQGSLLRLLCQPDMIEEPVPLPRNLSVWGVDSGLRHAVSGADYGTVRVAAFMGYRLLLSQAGIADESIAAADVRDTRWGGYLANVSADEYESTYAALLPETLNGAEFLQRFDATTDPVTQVNQDSVYAVRACTAHPIHEHHRVRRFAALCLEGGGETVSVDVAQQMGDCLLASHASYSACGLGSTGTDDIVDRLQRAGTDSGIYGARITGGGSGGTVAVLANANAGPVVQEIAQDYYRDSGMGGQLFSGSSDGAAVWRLQPAAL